MCLIVFSTALSQGWRVADTQRVFGEAELREKQQNGGRGRLSHAAFVTAFLKHAAELGLKSAFTSTAHARGMALLLDKARL